ncbi:MULTISPECIES: phage portal protein [Streptomyces]|uniref:phage portal protein n=1 Tax=Streptomyces TaxID=1883 RepID=UPI001E63BCAA|nr:MULTISPECIES: phage portal protein [Streptomyces]UFQ16404.1 phage portal protein [Streptomyces huasconensis]WCL86007.1 phage portal protein [Streptomyces sp. JCM 35825]
MPAAKLQKTPGDNIGSPPASPAEWMDYLKGKLAVQQGKIRRYGEYYDGRHQKMLFAQSKYRSEFADVFDRWSDNFCGLVIDSVNERLAIEGFRMTDEPQADQEARRIWQKNFLDAESASGHLDAMAQGSAYVVVWADEDGDPVITVESAETVVVQFKPGSRREVEAAAKFFVDDWGREHCTLWLEDVVCTGGPSLSGYKIDKTEKNPLKVVPVVPLQNRTRLIGEPMSDLAPIIPLQDAINKVTADALVASEYAAWPQRYVTGLEIQEDERGRPIEPFRVAVDKLLQAEDPAASFGQFEAADLSNYVHLVDMLTMHLASVARVPFHYLLKGGQVPSGDSITSAEAGLIAKTRERMLHFGEAWEKVLRLSFLVLKDKERAEAFEAEVMWRDPENRTEAQHVDSLLKLQQLSVPKQQLWLDAGYTPQQIERFQDLLEEEAKTEMEMADKYMTRADKAALTQPGQEAKPGGGDKSARKAAGKAPQGNSGNVAREKAGV